MVTATVDPRPSIDGRQRLVMLVLLGAGFMLSVDFSILNVAVPAVAAGVGLDSWALPWITAAYALPAAGFTLLFGRMADLFGRRRLFLSGIAVLAGASVLGGFASTPATLLTARVLQGFATAMATPAALSLLTTTFSEGATRARVLGLNGALLSAGFTVGNLVGGTLVSLLGWRAAFFINVPAAVLILLIAPVLIAESRNAERQRLDAPGAFTVTAGLLALVYGVIDKNVVAAGIGLVLLAAFWMIELRSPAPLAPMWILRRPTVMWGNYAGLVILTMEPAMIFLLTLHFQQTLGLSPFAAGLVFGIPGLGSVVAGVVAGRLLGRFDGRVVLTAGLAVQGVATLPLLFLTTSPMGLVVVVPALFVGFFGHVSAIVAYTVTATSGLPDHEQGLATGLASMTQQVALTVGIPVLASVAATQAVQLAGMRLALGVDVVVTLTSVALIWWGLGCRRASRRGRAWSAGGGPNGRRGRADERRRP